MDASLLSFHLLFGNDFTAMKSILLVDAANRIEFLFSLLMNAWVDIFHRWTVNRGLYSANRLLIQIRFVWHQSLVIPNKRMGIRHINEHSTHKHTAIRKKHHVTSITNSTRA